VIDFKGGGRVTLMYRGGDAAPTRNKKTNSLDKKNPETEASGFFAGESGRD
jgi:hypothetical protein